MKVFHIFRIGVFGFLIKTINLKTPYPIRNGNGVFGIDIESHPIRDRYLVWDGTDNIQSNFR